MSPEARCTEFWPEPSEAGLDPLLFLRVEGGDVFGRPAIEKTSGPVVEEGRFLRCRFCGEPISREDDAIEVGGRFVHRRTNPGGFTYEFGCFAEAPGLAPQGPSSAEDTWFPEFWWTVGLCRGCRVHLGWIFEGPSAVFRALILDRLERQGGV